MTGRNSFLIGAMLFGGLVLNACQWCVSYEEAQRLAREGIIFPVKSEHKPTEPKVSEAPQGEQATSEDKKSKEEKNKLADTLVHEVGRRFYREYLKTYYPNAWVMTEYFYGMCADAVIVGLAQMTDMLAHNPWEYFQDRPERFRLSDVWEVIVRELDTVSRFLDGTAVNIIDKTVLMIGQDKTPSHGQVAPIKSYFIFRGKGEIYYRFYALYADWVNKLFNEAVGRECVMDMDRYHKSFSRAVTHLEGSKYESQYKEHIRTNNELIALVRRRAEESQTVAKGLA